MENIVNVLKALSDPNRYRMVRLLLTGDHCVKALALKLNISEPAVSQHMKVLKTSGIVHGVKKGYFMHYNVDRSILKEAGITIMNLSEAQKLKTAAMDAKAITAKEVNDMANTNKCDHPELKPENGTCSDELQMKCHGTVCASPNDIPESGICSEAQCKNCHGSK